MQTQQIPDWQKQVNEIWKMFRETDRKFNETDKKFTETDRKIKDLNTLFTGQWGKLVESLVEGNLPKLLQQRDIAVTGTQQRCERRLNNKIMEVDIIAKNRNDIVAVEVKTALGVRDVNDFVKKLKDFKRFFSEYAGYRVYGAVAFLRVNSSADLYAVKKGLFVIRATGDSASIINNEKFKPKIW